MSTLGRCTRILTLAILEPFARLFDDVAIRLDAQTWPSVAIPLIWIADAIDRYRSRLERGARGRTDGTP
jgi:hypothetical protein